VMKVLKNEKDAPQDLREKSLYMAGLLIDMSGRYWLKKGKNVAREVLDSGKAYDQMQRIIKAQGAKKKALRRLFLIEEDLNIPEILRLLPMRCVKQV